MVPTLSSPTSGGCFSSLFSLGGLHHDALGSFTIRNTALKGLIDATQAKQVWG